MDEATWIWLADMLLAEAGRLSGNRLRRVAILRKTKCSDLNGAVALIDRHTRNGKPVLVELAGSYQHYTTIVGVSDNRLLLFNSYGYRWISAASCELDHHDATARQRITPSSAGFICGRQ